MAGKSRAGTNWLKWLFPAAILVLIGAADWQRLSSMLTNRPRPNLNQLSIGKAAGTDRNLDIAINPPAELNFKSRAEILAMRKEAVRQHAELLAGIYEPDDLVFRYMADRLPWWGIDGMYYWGPGKRSIEGAADQSRLILNPYLLVAPEFDLVWTRWDKERQGGERTPAGIQLYCPAESLKWNPRQARAEITYNLSGYARTASARMKQPLIPGDNFSFLYLTAYNARDMNLNFMFLSPDQSENIDYEYGTGSPTHIGQYIAAERSSGYPGGCNGACPSTAVQDRLYFHKLPARAVILLWNKRPGTAVQSPDMTYVINLK